MLYKLVSSAGTGYLYTGKLHISHLDLTLTMIIGEKNIKNAARKLMLRKYDPIVNRYVLFTEQKLKK